MIILDDIEEDQFLKVRGIEVLLIEDAGDRKKEHLYHVPTNQHIRNSIFQNSMSYLSKFI